MFADYNYYTQNYKGKKIEDANEYEYLARKADLYIKKYTDEVNENTKDCECAISEYLQASIKQGNMASENIPNFYSVSWHVNDRNTNSSEINAIIELYLGYSSVGVGRLIG